MVPFLAALGRVVMAFLVLLLALCFIDLILPIRVAFRISWQEGVTWHWQLRLFSVLVARQWRGPLPLPARRWRWVEPVERRAVETGRHLFYILVHQALTHPQTTARWLGRLGSRLSLTVRRFSFHIEGSTGDPASTALLYGLGCSIISALWSGPPGPQPPAGRKRPGSLPPRLPRPHQRVELSARLQSGQAGLRFSCILVTRPGQIILALIHSAWPGWRPRLSQRASLRRQSSLPS
ncbi:MAG: DUF2953 domain-containing protein [Limnochordaceae bacterium]|nr:DUF2953 domain-containing protein [Limnochordaceae bacterium]